MSLKSKSIKGLLFVFILLIFNKCFSDEKRFKNYKNPKRLENLKKAYNQNPIYYPTRYSFKRDFCNSSIANNQIINKGCYVLLYDGSTRWIREDLYYRGLSNDFLKLDIFLEGEAVKERLNEITSEIYEKYKNSFKEVKITFWLHDSYIPFNTKKYSQSKSQYTKWRIVKITDNNFEPKIEFGKAPFHSERIKAVVKKMHTLSKENNEELVGVWMPTMGKDHFGHIRRMFFLFREEKKSGKIRWRYEFLNLNIDNTTVTDPTYETYVPEPLGGLYRSDAWFNSNKEVDFRFTRYSDVAYARYKVSCASNKCGDLTWGSYKFRNLIPLN